MHRNVLVALLALFSAAAAADEEPLTQREAMKKLEFICGEWRGEGWMQRGETRETFNSYENVQFKAGGYVLLVEGRHGSADGKSPSFEAIAMVTYDEKTGTYRWRSYTSEGRGGETELKLLSERVAQWSPAPTVRYTLDLAEKDRWIEVGEFSRDGKQWRKFFEMTLQRSK